MDCPFCGKPLVRHTRADLYHCVLMIGETNTELLAALERIVDEPDLEEQDNAIRDAVLILVAAKEGK